MACLWPAGDRTSSGSTASLAAYLSRSGRVNRCPARPSELGADEDELVARARARDFVDGARAGLTLQAVDPGVFEDDVDGFGPVVPPLADPVRERRASRDELGQMVARVEVLALPVHLVGDERLGLARAAGVVSAQ